MSKSLRLLEEGNSANDTSSCMPNVPRVLFIYLQSEMPWWLKRVDGSIMTSGSIGYFDLFIFFYMDYS